MADGNLRLVYLNSVFYAGAVLITVCGTALLLPFLLFLGLLVGADMQRQILRGIIWIYGKIVLAMAWPLVRVGCHRPKSPLPPPPYIIVCNHRSASDAFLMCRLTSAGIGSNVVQLVKQWPFKIPILGWVARWAGYLSINEISFSKFLECGTRLLNDGVSIISFPEGTRSGSKAMNAFHSGVFRLAREAQVPLIPCCIAGNENIPRKGSLIIRPGEIRMRLMDAFQPADYEGLTATQFKKMVQCSMQAELDRVEERGRNV